MSIVTGLVVIVLIFAVTMIIMLLIQRSSSNGRIVVEKDEATGDIKYSLDLDIDPYEIEHMKHISFKVIKQGSQDKHGI